VEENQMSRLTVLCFGIAIVFPSASMARNPRQSDPQALSYAAQAIVALTGGAVINDVTLTGNVTWNGGSESGSATLRAIRTGESRVDLVLSKGTRTEIRDSQTGTPVGRWTNPDGRSGLFAFQSCQTDAAWFFPVFGSLAGGPNVVLSYIGQETRNGEAVQHIRTYVYQPTPPPGISIEQLSTMDFYLDADTVLPVAVTFNTYPDNGTKTALPVEVDFSNYQKQSGVFVPMTITRYLQGNLAVALTMSSVEFNTGLPLSIFSVKRSQQ
jgi:hypothetical protein